MTKVVAAKKAAKRQQTEELERIHGRIVDILTDAKKYFQKLSEKDLAVLGQNLEVFHEHLRDLKWELYTYRYEMETKPKINELQRYVDQGLKFTSIEIDDKSFCLKDTKNGPKVMPVENEDFWLNFCSTEFPPSSCIV